MNIPETYKEVDIDGRKFILSKMDARTASYMLFKLIKIITPIFKNIKLEKLENLQLDDINFTEIADSLFDLPEKEFRFIQDNCLKAVKESLPAGPQKILDDHGVWGVANIEFDVTLVMNLTIQSLVFNLSGFFGGNLLHSLSKRLTTSQQD